MPGTLTLIKGDLFQTDREVIGHGVNAQGVMASGFAAAIVKRYPEVKRLYLARFVDKKTGRANPLTPGEVQVVKTDDYNRYVANMVTQEFYGRDGKCYVDYDAVRRCFETVLGLCVANGWGLAVPKIGAGLGGGDWARIEGIIRDCLLTRPVEVDVYYL